MKNILVLFILINLSCCPDPTNHPTYRDYGNDGKEVVAGDFLEIAGNPEANSYQLHTVKLMMDYVEEDDVDNAYLKLSQLDTLSLDFYSLRFVYYQDKDTGKKYCSGSIDINNYIQDLTPISEFVNITSLNLSDNNIENIDPLIPLSELTVLKMNNNKLKNISVLGTLKKLETLELYNNFIDDYSPLLELPNLKYLYIGKNNSSDFSVLNPLIENGLVVYQNEPEVIYPDTVDSGSGKIQN